MKKLALAIAMLFLMAGIAGATEFSISGNYHVAGNFEDSLDGTEDEDENMYYDHELSLSMTWQIDDTTKVFLKVEIMDDNWADNTRADENTGNAIAGDDSFAVEELWGQHTFGNGHILKAGLMSAGSWGTSYADAGDEKYRFLYTIPSGIGNFILGVEKIDEAGADDANRTDAVDSEEWDDDSYLIGFVTKVGDVTVMPLVKYWDIGEFLGITDVDVWSVQLALTGAFGALNFEFEADYFNVDADADIFNGEDSAAVYGVYANVWTTMDALTVGAKVAWGSHDDDANFAFDAGDFDGGGAMIMGDTINWAGFNDVNGGNSDMGPGYTIALYAGYAASEKLSFDFFAAYAKCDADDNTGTDDSDVWEINVQGAYKITDNLTYSAGIAYADLDAEVNGADVDTDAAIEAYHKINFAF